MLRQVQLPGDVKGQLFLDGMPGRYESFATAQTQVSQRGISRVVCLAPLEEIRRKSPDYASAISESNLPWVHESFEIPDYDAPKDQEAFLRLAQETAACLRSGESVLIHCGAGVGRTGMLAVCVLLVLGVGEGEARTRVGAAGSGSERPSQDEVIRWVAENRVGE